MQEIFLFYDISDALLHPLILIIVLLYVTHLVFPFSLTSAPQNCRPSVCPFLRMSNHSPRTFIQLGSPSLLVFCYGIFPEKDISQTQVNMAFTVKTHDNGFQGTNFFCHSWILFLLI